MSWVAGNQERKKKRTQLEAWLIHWQEVSLFTGRGIRHLWTPRKREEILLEPLASPPAGDHNVSSPFAMPCHGPYSGKKIVKKVLAV